MLPGLRLPARFEAFVAVEGAEQGFEVGVEGGAVVVVQLVGLGDGGGEQQGQCAGEFVPHGVLHVLLLLFSGCLCRRLRSTRLLLQGPRYLCRSSLVLRRGRYRKMIRA
ncbi:hypothetical protein PPS11_25125 [Pseudomonas putida S11]|nr:hypothetical protein PPS11_25125 [Pseudomonas putida S11]